jgi:glycosyltransferase involved in cell wall biosynthesis
MMINAFNKVKQNMPGLKLILIGDGDKMHDLRQLVESLDIKDDVIFTGFIDNPQKYISLFDIFLLSSFSEGTSMTLLEAMSLAKPCVVTNVGGNPEIVINNETGITVQSDDVDSFTRAINELLQNDSERNEYGIKGKACFEEKFSVGNMVASYQNLYFNS